MRMVEKMARAMVAEDSGPEGSALFDIHWREFGEGYMVSARAAIEAMREPEDEMAKAGIAAWEKSPMAVVTQFRAMIDKAVQESGE